MAASLPFGTTAPRGLPQPELIRWPLVAARDLFELKYGKALVEAARRPGSVPVYGTNGRCGSHDEALFKSWFVNFDPVRAKAEGRDPGLPMPLADVFPPASWTPNWARFRRGGR